MSRHRPEISRSRSLMRSRRKTSVAGMIKRSRTIHLSDEGNTILPKTAISDSRIEFLTPIVYQLFFQSWACPFFDVPVQECCRQSMIHCPHLVTPHRRPELDLHHRTVARDLKKTGHLPIGICGRVGDWNSTSYKKVHVISMNSLSCNPNRVQSTQYENVDIGELLTTLRETDSLEEQGDILTYFVVSKWVSPGNKCCLSIERWLWSNVLGGKY